MDLMSLGLFPVQILLIVLSLLAVPAVRRGQVYLIPVLWLGPLALLFPFLITSLGVSSVTTVLSTFAACVICALVSVRATARGSAAVSSRLLEWNRTDLFYILVLVVLSVILFRRPLFAGGTLDSSEDIAQSLPYVVFYARSVLNGEVPLWNPYSLCGTPFLANIQSAVFYPGNLLYLILPAGYGFAVDLWLHILWLGVGVYVLARLIGCARSGALIAAASFMLSGFPVARVFASHKNLLNTLAWVPWVLGAGVASYRRPTVRYIGLLAIGGGLQILAGYPQLVQYTWVMMIGVPMIDLWTVAKRRKLLRDYVRRVAGLAGALFGAVCIGAVQLLPTAEFIPLSNRAEGVSLDAAINGAPFVQTISNYLFPMLFGLPREGTYFGAFNYMELASYVGIIGIALAFLVCVTTFDKKKGTLLIGILLAFLLVLGDRTPLIQLMCAVVPGAKNLQGPFRWNVAVALGLCLLGGLVWTSIILREIKRKTLFWHILKVTGPVLLFLSLFVYSCSLDVLPVKSVLKEEGKRMLHTLYYDYNRGISKPFEEHLNRLDTVITHGISHAAGQVFLLGLVTLGLTLCVRGRLRSERLFPIFILLLAVDLLHVHGRFVNREKVETYFPRTEFVDRLATKKPHSRFMHLDRTFSYNGAQLFGIRSCNGYDSLLPKSIAELYAAQSGEEVHGKLNKIHFENPSGETAAALAIDAVLCTRELDSQNWELLEEKPGMVYVRRNYRDFQFLDPATIRLYLRRHPIRRAWIAEGGSETDRNKAKPAPDSSGNRVTFVSDEINRVELSVTSSEGGLLVLCDTNYPGWRVFVDGEEKQTLSVNGFARGVVLPAGESSVEYRFESRTYQIGLFVSEYAVAAILFWVLVDWRNSRASRRQET